MSGVAAFAQNAGALWDPVPTPLSALTEWKALVKAKKRIASTTPSSPQPIVGFR